MAQQFLADAQDLAAGVTIVTTAETTGPTTNFLPLPYQNGKFRILAVVQLTTGTGVTGVALRVRRNPSAENVVVNTVNILFADPSEIQNYSVACVDPVPDGRSCQYAVTVSQIGATGNGTILAGSHIEAVALSG